MGGAGLLRRIRSQLTYANAVASLALFVALGGASYAAIKIPVNSVGPRQLKPDAVTSAKVKDGSLQREDFAKGEVPAPGPTQGPPGPIGLTGPKGEQGAPGADGTSGADPGPSLLDPANYLAGGGFAQLTVEGDPLAIVPGYRIDCGEGACTLTVGGSITSDMSLDSWFETARVDPSLTRDLTLVQFSQTATPQLRYHLDDALPIARRTLNDRFEMTFSAAQITRVAV